MTEKAPYQGAFLREVDSLAVFYISLCWLIPRACASAPMTLLLDRPVPNTSRLFVSGLMHGRWQ